MHKLLVARTASECGGLQRVARMLSCLSRLYRGIGAPPQIPRTPSTASTLVSWHAGARSRREDEMARRHASQDS
ncbi:hypothetical protein [Aerosticca soli]|jgi:hypothetical protein|uniref:hypothetical protein n=1 Tax=Aerosticca soli TaxID=2010829 RepID=UPI000F81F132|nr:hypothetical protein [Aerosticca soli]MDI3261610.1 hypothetical protein [Fulvimonas sp.]